MVLLHRAKHKVSGKSMTITLQIKAQKKYFQETNHIYARPNSEDTVFNATYEVTISHHTCDVFTQYQVTQQTAEATIRLLFFHTTDSGL